MRITKDATVNAVRDDSNLNSTVQKGKEQIKTPNAIHTTITTDQMRRGEGRKVKHLAWPSASSSGSPRGPSTVAQTAGGGGKRGPPEDGRRPTGARG